MSGVDDVQNTQRKHQAPYTPHHPIPTVQGYREEKKQRDKQYGKASEGEEDDRSKISRLGDAYTALRHGPEAVNPNEDTQPYPAENKNLGYDEEEADDHADGVDTSKGDDDRQEDNKDQQEEDKDSETAEDTTEGMLNQTDPKKARKAMKKFSADGTEREVTDPVTHLPVTIHDFTDKELKMTPKNGPPAGTEARSATGAAGVNKSQEQLAQEGQESQDSHSDMGGLFPPPDFQITREEVTGVYKQAITAGLGIVGGSLTLVVALFQFTRYFTGWSRMLFAVLEIVVCLGVAGGAVVGVRQWTENKINNVWETEVWEAERQQGKKLARGRTAESAQWLNSLLASVWPLINPDLFTAISDTLEDVMQASLPKMVRMVSVDDIGQGSEALRILGVRWLPTGAAARSVGEDGKLKSGNKGKSDRSVPNEGSVEDNKEEGNEDGEGGDENLAQGMEAEEGDFVNVEVAFAYRPSTGRKGMKERVKNAHLYLAFYMPSNVKLPVWVELQGFVGVMRMRLQLTPDPPFFSLCTLTFLGQPKVDIACVPLIKQGPNLMDFPLISRFVQSSVDAAMAEYVAPKSLTLDLKDMLMGDDFKKDTNARGVIMVTIKRAFDFKEGDAGIGPIKNGSADPYVSVGWAKFGKPLFSTRVLPGNMEPHWEETCFVLVTTEELNVDERLRLQLWDSDRMTADDDLGRIELDIKQLMKDDATNGKMSDREDGFKALKKGEGMPGKLQWSVGYFSKTRITDAQLAAQEEDPDIKDIDQLKEKVYKESEKKLREASKDESNEVEQQKHQDFKTRQDQLIIASPPPQEYPSGILSLQIHQITGLELETVNKNKASKNETGTDDEEEGDDLPSAYCTIILNHQKIFRTRTKPKNAKPFYNAGCERFIRDFRNTEVHIAVRDARPHEKDPLLGMIYLPLSRLLKHRSQIDASFPLSGGLGYGRARISLVFRPVQLQAPQNLLGWEFGTLEIKPAVKAIDIPKDLQNLRMKIRTTLARGKLHSGSQDSEQNHHDGGIVWKTKKDSPIRLAVHKRYSTPLVVEFRKDSALADRTPAFCVLWLKDIVDNEEQTIRLTVLKGDLSRAENNVLEEHGEKVGEIELTMTFWSGLSGYHSPLAKKDRHIADVMEVLDTCNDNDDMDWDDGSGSGSNSSNSGSNADDSSSSSSSSDDESSFVPSVFKRNSSGLDSDGKRGTVDQIREYKAHSKQLHRKNRGLMQWKGPRTLAYVKHLAKRGENKVGGLFGHGKNEGAGIETEA
ncbi:hypothetical protein CC80DRAFT_256363 [Byssothecium circinans]|uniref:Meiotically up-regulated gene 190 protein n=1 Tax=Byssothecium circinans TaxID=147558 RepID=A0A6A5TA85_9PLEO|nr:hypothetical protein CC80DRAFT_256363 [Byssothecium circinans]